MKSVYIPGFFLIAFCVGLLLKVYGLGAGVFGFLIFASTFISLVALSNEEVGN